MQIACLHIEAGNEQSENEIEKTIPFKIATKRMKYLGINLASQKCKTYTVKTTKQYEKNLKKI